MTLPAPPFLVITDRRQARRPLGDLAAAVLDAGGRWLLLRDKDLPRRERVALGRSMVERAAPYGAVVLMSAGPDADREAGLDAALEAGAAGVHLPRDGDPAGARERLGPRALIGVSAHDAGEIGRAAAGGADYATLSPIFASASKPGYGPALGRPALARIAAATGLPVLALGGVTAARVRPCLSAGAAGVAVMGAVMAAEDPESATRELLAECLCDTI